MTHLMGLHLCESPLTIFLSVNPNPHSYIRERVPVSYSWREGVESKLAAC